MRKLFIPLLTALVLVSYACTEKPDGPVSGAPAEPRSVGVDSISAKFLEQDSGNIRHWLESGASSRILVRMSGYDGLAPVSDEAVEKIRGLAEDRLDAAGDGRAEDRLFDAGSIAYVAGRLGMVRELYWVVPTFSSITIEDLQSFKDHLKTLYPESEKDIDAMTLTGGIVKGRINDMPVRILGLQDLRAPGEPVLLDIDASYIQALYQNEKDTSSLSFIAGMFKLLSETGISADVVSISASGEDRRAEFRFRAFARYLEKLLSEPGLIDNDPPELWSERAEAWRAEQNDPEIAVPIYKRITGSFPDDAATRYDLADTYFRLGELEAAAVELTEAARLDPGYAAAFEDYRDRLVSAGKPDIAAAFYSRRPGDKG